MDTTLSFRLALLSVLLRYSTSESQDSVSTLTKSKRDLTGLHFATLGPAILRPPVKKYHGVISALTQDGSSAPSAPSVAGQMLTKSIGKKNNTKISKERAIARGPFAYSRPLGPIYDPTNVNIQLTEAPSISLRAPAFQNNQIPSTSYLNSYAVNSGNPKAPGDSGKVRGNPHLNPKPAQKEQLYSPTAAGKFHFDSVSGFPIFSTFYGIQNEPLLQAVHNTPIYRTRHTPNPDPKDARAVKAESDPSPTFRDAYNIVHGNKVTSYPYLEFAELPHPLNKQQVLGTTVKLHTKQPSYSFDFVPSYGIPSIGNANYFSAQPNIVAQVQQPVTISPLQSATSAPQFSQYKAPVVKPTVGTKKVQFEPYQALVDQPQLHFTNPRGPRPENKQEYLKPNERIRTDVEVVDKKKPSPPKPSPPDDDSEGDDSSEEDDGKEDDDGYKFIMREYGPSSNDEDDYSEKFSKEKEFAKTYNTQPYSFQLYDEKFGKYSKKPEVNNNRETTKSSSPFPKFNFNNDDDDSDEYLSQYHSDYTAKQDYDDKSIEETQVNEKHEENEDNGYHLTTQSPYESYESEFDKNYGPLIPKNTPIKSKSVGNKAKVYKSDESVPYPHENRAKVSEAVRNNYQEKPNWYGAQYSSHSDSSAKPEVKKQSAISYKRNVDITGKKNNGSEDSFGYKFPKAKSTLKAINQQHVDARIHTNSQSPGTQSSRPSFHKSNIPGNENGPPPQEARNSYSVSAENKWLLNKRSQDKTDSRVSPRLKALSDVYITSNPSFFATKEIDYRSLAGI